MYPVCVHPAFETAACLQAICCLRTGSYIFVDASPDACNISEAIFFL